MQSSACAGGCSHPLGVGHLAGALCLDGGVWMGLHSLLSAEPTSRVWAAQAASCSWAPLLVPEDW